MSQPEYIGEDKVNPAWHVRPPPDACWLCWKSLGTTEECPMCALKRLEDAALASSSKVG